MQSGQSSVIYVIGRNFIMSVQKLLVATFLLEHPELRHFVPSSLKRYRLAVCITFSIFGCV